MLILIISLVLAGILSALFILLSKLYKDYLEKTYIKEAEREREKTLDNILDKYVVEDKKDLMREKLSKISKIIESTEKEIEQTVKKKVKVAEKAQVEAKGKELKEIKDAEEQYISFSAGLRSAMPETEEERKADMAELKNVVSMLESFDQDHYKVSDKKVDAGVGMFYDKMSRRFKKIISEHKLNEHKIVPIQRLKYHVFQNVRNIKDNDILPILKVMEETNLLNKIIEINPTFYVIKFTDEKIQFSLKETVVLTFAYDEDFLTTKKLKELTEWKEDYMERIIQGLEKKGIIKVLDENITVEGFGHAEERTKWNAEIENQIAEQKRKEEEKRKRQLERRAKLKQKLAKVEEKTEPAKEAPAPEPPKSKEQTLEDLDSISPVDEPSPKKEFKGKPSVKTLPLPGKKAPKSKPLKKAPKKVAPEKKDEEDLLDAIGALDALSPGEETKSTDHPSKEVDLGVDFDDLGDEERDLEDLIPEKILEFHEKFSLINGGFAQFELISDYVKKELKEHGEAPDELIKAMVMQLKELQMVQNIQKIGDHEYVFFNKIMFSPVNKKFVEFAVGKEPMTKEEFMKGLDWPDNRVDACVGYLEKKGVLKMEGDKITIPGIKQKNGK